MPTLSTFGGASVRSYGRNIQQTPAVVPKDAVLFLQSASTTAPSGWQYYANGVGMFVRGASSNAEIGTTNTAQGSVTASGGTGTVGAHGTSSTGISMFAEYSMATIYSYNTQLAQNTAGTHNHTLTVGPETSSTSPPPHYKFPIVTTSTIANVLPPNTIIFRKTAPSSQNYVKPVYYTETTADRTYFRGHNGAYSIDTAIKTNSGYTAYSGNHSHRGGSYSGRPSSGGTSSLWGYETAAGQHLHSFTLNWRVLLKSKMLNAWVSPFEETIEYGMIILYTGQPKNLPAGWRVCDGTLGTPDMRGYYLGGWYNQVSGSHDIVLKTSNEVEVTSTDIQNLAWSHSHYGGNRYGDNAFNALHTSFTLTHNHSNLVNMTATFDSTYDPGTCNLAFIQYKGI